jgi:[glutamine synthetase] adenylyltransferase / [glutamine synthetase]-adenylyl-L-tyrosine phosphorylase
MISSVQPASADVIREQLGNTYDYFDAAERSRHVQMLQSIKRPEDVALHTQLRRDNHWVITVCTSDCLGALSTISGLLAAYHFDIVSAHIYTLDFPSSGEKTGVLPRPRRYSRRTRLAGTTPPRRRILDIFEVRALKGSGQHLWKQFETDLSCLIGMLVKGEQNAALDQVIERFSEAVENASDYNRQLLPISVELSNDASSKYTRLSLRSADTLGFLFAFTNALAIIDVNIEQAEIQTIRGEVQDTFWLTDRGGRKIERTERIQELRVVTALIKHFTYLLPRSPNPVQALRQFNALTHQMLSHPHWTKDLHNLESTTVMETLADLMGVSQFLWEDFLRMQYENLFPVLLDMPALDEGKLIDQLQGSLRRQLSRCANQEEQAREINRFKDREMFRIDLRHITKRIGFREFAGELSDLAEVVIEATARLSHQELEPRFGSPALDGGQPCPWCICALGKFGGRELGFGSDIELIFVYQAEGVTSGPSPVENSRYFGDFVRACLGKLTTRRKGIFEIDLRLRPYGTSGPLASTLEGFNEYYSHEGNARQFERMALVKLRPVAGDQELGNLVLQSRDAFVYSGIPLDVENILHLRQRQATELVPSGQTSAKHSPGGLVDMEYYVQACQVAVGHLNPGVRVSNTLNAIEQLARDQHLSEERATELSNTYSFLRRLIDALRVVRGHARDLTIPALESREFAYLARRLQYDSPEQLQEAIAAQMGLARKVWDSGIPPNNPVNHPGQC